MLYIVLFPFHELNNTQNFFASTSARLLQIRRWKGRQNGTTNHRRKNARFIKILDCELIYRSPENQARGWERSETIQPQNFVLIWLLYIRQRT
jgi:hypothetical protein